MRTLMTVITLALVLAMSTVAIAENGIYEDFGDNLFTNKITTLDTIETPVFVLADSSVHFITSGDTLATKQYVDDNSGGYTFESGLTETTGTSNCLQLTVLIIKAYL